MIVCVNIRGTCYPLRPIVRSIISLPAASPRVAVTLTADAGALDLSAAGLGGFVVGQTRRRVAGLDVHRAMAERRGLAGDIA